MRIKIEAKGFEQLLKDLSPQLQTKIVSRTLNRTAQQAITEAKKLIREKYNVKTKGIRIKHYKAMRTNLTTYLGLNAKPVSLLYFGARKTKAGASVEVKKGSRKIIKARPPKGAAFIQTMPKGGGKGVFRRKGPKRLKIEKLYSLSPLSMFENNHARLKLYINKRMQVNFEQSLKFYIMRKQ